MSIVCKLLRVPLLLHLHARYQQRDRFVLLFHFADKIVGVSKAVLALFAKNEFDKRDLSVIYNGISPKRVNSKDPVNIRKLIGANDKDHVVLFIGSLIARKGLETLLCSLARLKDYYCIKLAIFGDGEQQQYLTHLIKELSLTEVVSIFPAISDVGKYYASNADSFVSTPTEEVFGLTLAEASLARLPVIGSNVPGVNEVFMNNVQALLVKPLDVNQLALALIQLIENPSLGQRLANNAHEHVKNQFSINKQSIEFERQYRLIHEGNQQSTIYCITRSCYLLAKAICQKANTLFHKIILREYRYE